MAASFVAAPAVLAQSKDEALDQLAASLSADQSGTLVRPGSAAHRKIKYWNARFDCGTGTTYARPTSAEGALKIVEWARTHTRKFAIRGGGHSFEGKSSHPDLVIDTAALQRLELGDDGTLDAGAGVLLGTVYGKLSPLGRVFPGGTCPTVGLIGHTLGGGIGDFLPMHGFAAQSMLAVELVTFAGSILRIDDEKVERIGGEAPADDLPAAADLMKVLRGGGQGSLGIVTGMKFKTYDASKTQFATFKAEATEKLSRSAVARLILGWQEWRSTLPPAMMDAVSSKINFGRDGDGYSLEILGLIAVRTDSAATFAEVRQAVDRLMQLPNLKGKSISKPLKVPAVIKSFLDDDETTNNPKRKQMYGSSAMLPEGLPPAAVDYFLANFPAGVYASFYTSGGATKTGRPTSLAPSEFLIEWVAWTKEARPALYKRVRGVNLGMMDKAGFAPYAMPNYCDAEERDYFTNRDQIEVLRGQFDPDQLSTSSLLLPPKGAAGGCG